MSAQHAFRILLMTTLLIAVAVPGAASASPSAIHRDAADGSIDGTYTLAELRAADRTASTEQREYFAWEDIYNHHLQSLAPVRNASSTDPRGTGGTGAGGGTARRMTAQTPYPDDRPSGRNRTAIAATRPETAPASGTSEARAQDPAARTSAAAASPSRTPSDGGVDLIWLLAAVPVLITGAGAWGIVSARRSRRLRSPALPR